jgi:outer membrane PBP1 activator LpoA protein
MGSGLMTSGFGQSLGAAGANLQTQLAQMKEQYRRQSINDLLQQYNQLSSNALGTNTFENTYTPPTQDPLMEIIKGVTQAGASIIGGPLAKAGVDYFMNKPSNNQTQSQPFSAGTPGNGYQGRFGELPNYAGY